jgi:hypothetical protein
MSNFKKIKTFEDACKKLGLDPVKVIPDFSMYPEQDKKALIAHAKLVIIAKALNDGWKPDWENGNWDKFYPWFKMSSSSGAGFAYGDCDGWGSDSSVGSRLCFVSSEVAEYAGKQFEELYKQYFVI